ncbi:MAG: hypothetical protein LBG08_03400 [Spirochaetaceae bacterium]|jgi:hypothetical protein|nr:hypothetical protein [Spirochaetaceae bacterium]
MKTKLSFVLILLALVSLAVSCNLTIIGDKKLKHFSSYLSDAPWECTAPDFWPEGQTANTATGRLTIDFDTITITGPVKALGNFTHTVPLSGYSEKSSSGYDSNGGYWEEGLIHINDKGTWQGGIAYKLWTAGDRTTRMLTLIEGSPNETTLKRLRN